MPLCRVLCVPGAMPVIGSHLSQSASAGLDNKKEEDQVKRVCF